MMRRDYVRSCRVCVPVIICCLLILGLLLSPRQPSVPEDFPEQLYVSVGRVYEAVTADVTLPSPASVIPLIEGEEITAGREAWVLRLNPRQKPSPWVQLWVDKKTMEILAFREWSAEDVLVRAVRRDVAPTDKSGRTH